MEIDISIQRINTLGFWSIPAAELLTQFLHEHVDVLIIIAIVFIRGLLGFWQERGAANAVEKLLAIVQIKATVLRDGSPRETPGDRQPIVLDLTAHMAIENAVSTVISLWYENCRCDYCCPQAIFITGSRLGCVGCFDYQSTSLE